MLKSILGNATCLSVKSEMSHIPSATILIYTNVVHDLSKAPVKGIYIVRIGFVVVFFYGESWTVEGSPDETDEFTLTL